MSDLKKQIEITADATGVEAGVGKAKRSLADLGATAAAAGKTASAGIEQIGTGGEQAASKVDRVTKNLAESIQRATAAMQAGAKGSAEYFTSLANVRGANLQVLKPYIDELTEVTIKTRQAAEANQRLADSARFLDDLKARTDGIGKSAADLAEMRAAALGVGDAAAPMIAKLRAAEQPIKGLGVSVAQTAAAMRQVPAQFTDIVTSLQAGQRPLSVLLQQGGQLKDAFGGIGPAARALGGYVAGLITPLTVAAAAGGLLAVAFFQGRKEAEEYNKALILSGNVAGTTAGQLQGLAQSVSKSIGTQGAAAAVLAQMAGNSKIASEGFEQFTRVALQMEKAVGKSVSDTIKELEQLGDSPVEASEKLNQQYHYLTASVYEQIKALQDQGKTEEAAAVAQKAYADAFEQRSKKLLDNLGYIEKAWNGITGAAKGAWDAMQGIGRPETTTSKLEKLRADLEAYNPFSIFGPNKQELEQQITALEKRGFLEFEFAQAQAASVKQAEAKIAWDKEGDKYLTRRQQLERELEAVRNKGAEAGASEVEIQQRLADVRKKYSDIYNDSIDSQIEAIKRRGSIEDEITKRSIALLQTQRQIGALNEEQATQAIAAAELAAIDKRRVALVEELSLTKSKQNSLKEQQAIEGQIALLKEQRLSREKQLENELLMIEVRRTRAAAENLANLYDNVDGQVQRLREQVLAQQDYNAAIGLSKEQVAQLDAEHLRYQATLADENAEMADLIDWSGKLGDKYREQAEQLRKLADTKIVGAQKEALVDMWRSVDNAAHDAFVHIFDGGKSVLDRLRDTLKTGLLDLLYQLTVKKWVLNIGASITGSLGFAEAANAASTVGGSGNVGTAINAASMAKNGLGWLTDFGGSVSNTVQNWGIQLAKSNSEFLRDVGSSMFENSEAIGNFAESAGQFVSYASALKSLADGKYGQAAGTAIGQYFGGPIGAYFGSKIGGWVDNQFSGETRGGAQYAYSFDGTVSNNRRGTTMSAAPGTVAYLEGPSGGEIAGDDVRKAIAGAVDTINGYLKGLGSAATLTAFQAGLETSEKGRGGVFAGGKLSSGAAFGLSGAGDNYAGTLFDKAFATSGDAKTMLANFSTELKQTTIQALQAAADIPQAIADKLKGVDVKKLTEEQSSAVLTSIGNEVAAVNQFRDAIVDLPFENLKNLSFDAADGLIAASGGLEALKANLSGYYQNYFTAEEKKQQLTKTLTEQFQALGFSLPTTREQFRQMVESVKEFGPEGAKTEVGLLKLQGALSELLPPLSEVSASASDAASSVRTLADIFKDQLSSLDTAYSGLERSVDAEKARLNQIYEDQKSAIEAAATAQKDAAQLQLDAASDSLQSIQSIYGSLTNAIRDARKMTVEEAQGVLDTALQSSNAGGSLTKIPGLDDALRVVTQSSEEMFATHADFVKYQALTASKIDSLRGNASAQASVAQMTVDALKDTVKAIEDSSQNQLKQLDSSHQEDIQHLDDILASAKAQIDALNGIDNSVKSLTDAMKQFADSLSVAKSNPVGQATPQIADAYQTALGRTASQSEIQYWQGQVANGASASDVIRAIDNSREAQIVDLYRTLLGRDPDTAGLQFQYNSGLSVDQLRQNFMTSDEYLKKIRGFAVGTNYVPSDMFAKIHEGERIVPAADNAALIDALRNRSSSSAEMTAELQALRAENREMRESLEECLYAIAKYTQTSADILDAASNGGRPLQTEAA